MASRAFSGLPANRWNGTRGVVQPLGHEQDLGRLELVHDAPMVGSVVVEAQDF